MIEVSYSDGKFSVTYRMEGVRCTMVECAEVETCLNEVRNKMFLMRGLAKGKTFLTKTGKEI